MKKRILKSIVTAALSLALIASNIPSAMAVTTHPGSSVNSSCTDTQNYAKNTSESGEADISKVTAERSTIIGTSLTLGGEIGVNIYIKPTEEFISSGGYVLMQGPNITGSRKLYFTQENLTENGYRFTCTAYPTQMNEDVTVRLATGSGDEMQLREFCIQGQTTVRTVYQTSVCKYAQAVENDKTVSDKLKALTEAMTNYGAFAQRNFKQPQTPDMPANARALKNVTKTTLKDHAITFSDEGSKPAGFSYYGISLILKETTTLNIYFTMQSGKKLPNVVCDGKQLTVNKNGSVYYVSLANIDATDLCRTFNVYFDDYLIKLSPMSYAYNVLVKHPDSAELVNVCKALYNYSIKAKEYFAEN